MPRGDRTGPAGFGPMTGRGLGYCAGYAQPGFVTGRGGGMGYGRGFGGGRGGGFGRGFGRGIGYAAPAPAWGYQPAPYYPAPPTAGEEKSYLQDRASSLEQELSSLKQRLSELEEDNAE